MYNGKIRKNASKKIKALIENAALITHTPLYYPEFGSDHLERGAHVSVSADFAFNFYADKENYSNMVVFDHGGYIEITPSIYSNESVFVYSTHDSVPKRVQTMLDKAEVKPEVCQNEEFTADLDDDTSEGFASWEEVIPESLPLAVKGTEQVLMPFVDKQGNLIANDHSICKYGATVVNAIVVVETNLSDAIFNAVTNNLMCDDDDVVMTAFYKDINKSIKAFNDKLSEIVKQEIKSFVVCAKVVNKISGDTVYIDTQRYDYARRVGRPYLNGVDVAKILDSVLV